MNSSTLPIHKRWLATATPDQIAFVDSIFLACEQHYEQGGDVVVECFSPSDIIEQFKSIEDAKRACNLMADRAKDARWGEDSDDELKREQWR